jgi:hypothetical protein
MAMPESSRVVGAGDVLFGRTVFAAHIDRGAVNFEDQLAIWLVFADGTEMIVRGDPVSRFGIGSARVHLH